jgi:hypothetical protein
MLQKNFPEVHLYLQLNNLKMRLFKKGEFTSNKLSIHLGIIYSQSIWGTHYRDTVSSYFGLKWYLAHFNIYWNWIKKKGSVHSKYNYYNQQKSYQSLVLNKSLWLLSEWGHHTPYCKVLIIKGMGFRLLHIKNKYSVHNWQLDNKNELESYYSYSNSLLRNTSYRYQNISVNAGVEEIDDENLLEMFTYIVELFQEDETTNPSGQLLSGLDENERWDLPADDIYPFENNTADAFVGNDASLVAIKFKKKLAVTFTDLYDEETDEYISLETKVRYKKTFSAEDTILDNGTANEDEKDSVGEVEDTEENISVIPELNDLLDYSAVYTNYLVVRAGHSIDQLIPVDRNIHLKVLKKERKLVVFGWNKVVINNFINKVFNCRRPSVYTGNGIRRKHYTVIRKGGKEKDRKHF